MQQPIHTAIHAPDILVSTILSLLIHIAKHATKQWPFTRKTNSQGKKAGFLSTEGIPWNLQV